MTAISPGSLLSHFLAFCRLCRKQLQKEKDGREFVAAAVAAACAVTDSAAAASAATAPSDYSAAAAVLLLLWTLVSLLDQLTQSRLSAVIQLSK